MPPRVINANEANKLNHEAGELRGFWKGVKTRMLDQLKKDGDKDHKKAADALGKKFDQGLGPALDKWAGEFNKWPDWDARKLKAIRTDITTIVTGYKDAITHSEVPAITKIALHAAIDGVDKRLNDLYNELKEYIE